jgi:CBS domain-containing protein
MVQMDVKSIMNSNVVFAEVPGNREQVIAKLKEHKISGVPVVKKGTKKLIGIVTRKDLLKHPDEDQLALIMNTNVVTITPQTPLEKCVSTMLEKHFRRLPVIQNGELQGIITVGDIIKKVISQSGSPLKVKDLMKTTIFSCWGNTPVFIVSAIMNMAKENVALVINTEEKIVGLISNTDLMNLSEVKIEETKSVLKSSSESQEWDWETSSVLYITKGKIALPNVPLHKVMVTPFITITENETIMNCAIKMQKFDIDQLPVTNAKDEIIGMIYDMDMLKSM